MSDIKSIFDNTPFVHIDSRNQRWNKFICMYKDIKGNENGFEFWALDMDDAERRIRGLFCGTECEFMVLKVVDQG